MTQEWLGGETVTTLEGRAPNLPPDNELPALLATEPLIWRSADIAIAVLGLEVYTSGVEFAIAGRIRNPEVAQRLRDDPRFLLTEISDLGEEGPRITVRSADENVSVVSLGSESHDGHSFRCRAWVTTTSDDLTFSLEWPAAGISYTEYEVTPLREAASRAVRLWSADPP